MIGEAIKENPAFLTLRRIEVCVTSREKSEQLGAWFCRQREQLPLRYPNRLTESISMQTVCY